MATPDVVTGVFLSVILLIMFCVMLIYVPLLGTFVVNSFPSLVLFELGVSWSFVAR